MNAFLITMLVIFTLAAVRDLQRVHKGEKITVGDALASMLRMALAAWAIWLLAKG